MAETAAAADNRFLTSLIEKLLTDHLKKKAEVALKRWIAPRLPSFLAHGRDDGRQGSGRPHADDPAEDMQARFPEGDIRGDQRCVAGGRGPDRLC